jgi:branched-chain amino acid transport system permease protein
MTIVSSAVPVPTGRSRLVSIWLAVVGALAALLLCPYVLSQYQTVVLTYGLVMSIAAMGLNLLLGYTGLLSFGHSAFFGIGAYTVAMIARDVGSVSMEASIAAAALASGAIAGLFGIACVRHTRIFFGILTLALSQVLWSFVFKFYLVTGGTDGIRVSYSSVKLLGGLIDFHGKGAFQRFTLSYYYYVLAFFVVSIAALWVVVRSPFGMALKAIRDNEMRASFVGISTGPYKWLAFVISGIFTGIAGALWAPLGGHVTPEALYWPLSGEIVFMVVLGGFRSFLGPVVGAVLFNYLKTYAIAATEYWQLVLGLLLVVLVLALPHGLIGTVQRLAARRSRPIK